MSKSAVIGRRGGVIADVEVAIATSTPGTRRTFENTLDSAKKRVATLDKKIDDAKVEQRAEEQAKIAAANLVETEKALSASEKETYDRFLKEAFFTKKDFGKLEQFYAHTYDRLSEGGKDEMSHRVWEGVRHGEYSFMDLPKDVREKEEDRIYKKFTDPSRGRDSLEHIPEADRNDFIQAYKAGDRKEIGDVLNRESFRRNVATEDSKSIKHQVVTIGKAADDHEVLADDKTKDIAPSCSLHNGQH